MVLDLTDEIVSSLNLTTLMVTHNMKQAIALGNRLIMFHRGQVVLDIEGAEKQNLKVEDLLERFSRLRGDEGVSDRMLLG
jgi:putative ABC transport system ATP-binding protein